ncbi:hypothetical protein [Zavarzinia sp.]|uniref:hypothetical protein n=1 Tax=Zavarzinia sp. TaxID=2027920 RepID=UPI003567C0CD
MAAVTPLTLLRLGVAYHRRLGERERIRMLPLLYATFEAACVAAEESALPGLDAAAVQTIRTAAAAAVRKSPAGGSASPGGDLSAVVPGALKSGGRLTTAGVRAVAGKVAEVMQSTPALAQDFQNMRRLGAVYFYPGLDDGQIGLACSMVSRNGVPRVYFMPTDRASDAAQLAFFLKTCSDGWSDSRFSPWHLLRRLFRH